MKACEIRTETQQDFANGLYHLGKISPAEFARATVDELRSVGEFVLLRNAESRRQMNQIVQDFEQLQAFIRDIQGRLAPPVNYVDQCVE